MDGDPAAPFERGRGMGEGQALIPWDGDRAVAFDAEERASDDQQIPPASGIDAETERGGEGVGTDRVEANGNTCLSKCTCREVRTRPEARSKHR